ncbi:hypothetical protein ABT174_35240 [Streptomyces sparsogenes]|uniref:hypothetical protein n=1 Tax=Streptomyces sparsogenes TaxID=67365 RepID=UPI00331DDD55
MQWVGGREPTQEELHTVFAEAGAQGSLRRVSTLEEPRVAHGVAGVELVVFGEEQVVGEGDGIDARGQGRAVAPDVFSDDLGDADGEGGLERRRRT